jgi:tRNA A-37 threonylcarbamoyl transferase component Bud32
MKMIYLNLGFDFQSRGNHEKAFLCYKRVYDMDPDFEDVKDRLEGMRRAGVGTQMAVGHSIPEVAPVMPEQPPVEAPSMTPDLPDTGTLAIDEPEEATLQMTEDEAPTVGPAEAATMGPAETPLPTPTPTPPPTPAPMPTSMPPVATGPGVVGTVPGIEAQPGTAGSRYRLVKKLGKGAMGEVSLMEDTKLDRKVAIKTIRPDVEMSSRAAIEMRQRFVREAKTAGKLTHPNIVTVYDSFEGEGGIAYIVMEFVEGDTLANICKRAQLTVPQVKHVIVNAAHGLQHAHENGVFHRDVKPENIMISPKTGVTKLMDFGIARLVESNMTATGSVLGTPAYMSPEQVTGKKIDGRSDVFSLGVILYELLAGVRPFAGSKITAVMFAILQEEPAPPSTVDPGRKVSPEWDPVVAKAMAKDLEERYQSADDFANAVRAVRA